MKKKFFGKIISNPYVILGSYIFSFLSLILSICIGNKLVTYIILGCVGLYFIAITIYIFKRYFSIKRYKKNIKEALENETRKAIDEFINYTAAVLDDIKNLIYISSTKEMGDVKKDLNNLCAQLVKLFKLILGKNAVCIKTICTDSLGNTDYDKWSTQTIARDCEEDLVERREHDGARQSLKNNTSFYEVITDAQDCWASRDIVETKRNYANDGKPYKNPDINYLKYYKSTIVVPIYTKSDYMAQEIKKYITNTEAEATIHVLGFLCLDSKNIFVNDDSIYKFEKATQVAKIIGRTLYPVFENILIHELRKAQNH